MQEITHYDSEDILESGAVLEEKYPKELWDLVSPEDQGKVVSESLRFPEHVNDVLMICIASN